MKNLFTPLALLLLPSFNLKAQNVISPNNEKNGPTILRAVGDDSTVSDKEKVYHQVLDSNRVFLEEGKNCLNILHTMSSIQLTLQKTRLKDAY